MPEVDQPLAEKNKNFSVWLRQALFIK